MINGVITNNSSDLTQAVANQINQTSSIVLKAVWENVFTIIKPVLAIVGGLLGLYIIYKIVQGTTNYFMKKRIKRIDKNIQDVNHKVDLILDSLKDKTKIKVPKKSK